MPLTSARPTSPKSRRAAHRKAEGEAYLRLLRGLTGLSLLATITIPAMLWLVRVNAASQQSEIHPTAIPWLQDRQSCEATGRTWQQEKCWEREWSHLF